jgi:hypothetical protein
MLRKYHSKTEILADRLRHSRHPDERRSLFAGRTVHHGYPVLLDSGLLCEHMHILGPPGSGKTSLAVETLARQLIALGDGPLVLVDGKGDRSLLNSVLHHAYLHNRDVKLFTNLAGLPSYAFNPWDNRLIKRLALTDILGLFIQSLNLHHGDDYGRAWFGANNRHGLRRAILETIPDAAKKDLVGTGSQQRLFPKYGPIQSFRDLYRILCELAKDDNELKAAKHLALTVECLCDFEQINITATSPGHDDARAAAIFMPDVIEKKQIVYFFLAGALDNVAVAEIARLAIYSLYMAAIDYRKRHGREPRVYTIWDEAQIMVSKNIEYVLTQSRSAGIACILAHQAMSQLNPPGGVDLRELVMQCTQLKQIFGARDPWLLDYISHTSGITKYYRRGYDLAVADVLGGCVDPARTCADRDGERRVRVQEYTAPRLSRQDILSATADPNVSLMSIGHPTSLCPFQGWFPMYTEWPVPLETHQYYERQPWPKKTKETIETKLLWPEEIKTTEDHPVPDATPSETQESTETLDVLWANVQKKNSRGKKKQ